jgi:hypothetical protein
MNVGKTTIRNHEFRNNAPVPLRRCHLHLPCGFTCLRSCSFFVILWSSRTSCTVWGSVSILESDSIFPCPERDRVSRFIPQVCAPFYESVSPVSHWLEWIPNSCSGSKWSLGSFPDLGSPWLLGWIGMASDHLTPVLDWSDPLTPILEWSVPLTPVLCWSEPLTLILDWSDPWLLSWIEVFPWLLCYIGMNPWLMYWVAVDH